MRILIDENLPRKPLRTAMTTTSMAVPLGTSNGNGRCFADTSFWIALSSKRDQDHSQAMAWHAAVIRSGSRIVTTEALNGAAGRVEGGATQMTDIHKPAGAVHVNGKR